MKRLFIKATPNDLQTFENLMEKGHQLIANKEIDDFVCQINFKENCVKLYIITKN